MESGGWGFARLYRMAELKAGCIPPLPCSPALSGRALQALELKRMGKRYFGMGLEVD